MMDEAQKPGGAGVKPGPGDVGGRAREPVSKPRWPESQMESCMLIVSDNESEDDD